VPVPAGDEKVVKALVPEESPREEGAGRDRRVQRGVPVGHRLTVVLRLHYNRYTSLIFQKED